MHKVSKVIVCVFLQYQVFSPGWFHDFLGPACGGPISEMSKIPTLMTIHLLHGH
jgi:hypothetical protein